ncbi:MAG TPA: export ABC transporter ATP-binding protein [Bacteroidales bacterium]|nr:export ABC transporter ATP-binding protein [Bacteroidales bacterium]
MIDVRNISKSYGEIKALKSLSLHIKKGEFYSLLGPNGAGKTTCINLMGGLMLPDSGEIFLDGTDIKTIKKQTKAKIGIVPQEIALYNDLSARENLLFWAKIHRISAHGLNEKIDAILNFMDLADRSNQAISSFSGGMKRRINIAAALVHNPDILFFDEPTVGIDPQSRAFIYSIFKALKDEGKTILYTSHYLEEVEKLSDRIGIIDHGEMLMEGSFEELKKKSGLKESISIRFANIEDKLMQLLKNTPLIQSSLALGGSFSNEKCEFIGNKRSEDLSQIVRLFADHAVLIHQIDIQPVDLEQVYLCLTRTLRSS